MKLADTDVRFQTCSTTHGYMLKFEIPQVYISKPSDFKNQGTSLLILLTNGVGVNSVANQLQADHFAREGYFVAMPDLLVLI